jgi:hypothetical protein
MIIANHDSHKEKLNPPSKKKARYFKGLVVPQREIISLVANLLVKDLDAFAQRMKLVVEITCVTVSTLGYEEMETITKDQLSPTDLQTLKQVTREDKSEKYQRVMSAILEAVKQGPEGIRAANRTAAFGVKVAFGWSEEYYDALWGYEGNVQGRRYKQRRKRKTEKQSSAGNQ